MVGIWDSKRCQFAARIAAWHALLSVAIALLAGLLVFKGWYTPPFAQMLGVNALIALLIAVDLVCGPFLNFLLSNPRKTRKALLVDWISIALIQLGALTYGMYALWEARPVMIVFEIDRLVVVTANEISKEQLSEALLEFQKLPQVGVKFASTRLPRDPDERFKSLDMSLQGIEPSSRPDWWIPYLNQQSNIRARAQPLLDLAKRRPDQAASLIKIARQTSRDETTLLYLPLTSRHTKDWVAILDATTLEPLGYAPVDGF